jgi:uncharacterized protein YgiM (DUF1202 family)
MNKAKRALISLIVISTVFCLTIIFNIQLPFYSAKGSNPSSDDVVTAGSGADGAQEATIHSFNLNETEVFSVDRYLASDEAQNYPMSADADQDAFLNQETAVTPGAASDTTDETADPAENTSGDQSQALTASADPTAPAKDNSQEAAGNSADTEKAGNSLDQASAPEESEAVPEKGAEEEQPEALYADIGISIAKDYVNIRKEPSTGGEILGKLYRDSACTILSSENGWYYVESGSVTGYAKADYIKSGIPDDELIEKYGILKMIVSVDGLNVREDPSIEAKKLTVIYQNEKYPVEEVKDDWLLINIDDENIKGYVKKEFAELDVEFEDAVSKEEEQKILQVQAEERARKETEVKQRDGVNYTEADLRLLACLVHAEAGTQSYEGKLAVANVVLNRVKSSKYPDTIKAVIYQSGQFSVAASGSLEKQLNNYDNYSSKSQKLSIKAAKDALEGANNIGSRLYFHSYKTAARKGYTSYAKSVKLGDHLFW